MYWNSKANQFQVNFAKQYWWKCIIRHTCVYIWIAEWCRGFRIFSLLLTVWYMKRYEFTVLFPSRMEEAQTTLDEVLAEPDKDFSAVYEFNRISIVLTHVWLILYVTSTFLDILTQLCNFNYYKDLIRNWDSH
jgi:hypothetical protein